MFFVHFSPLHFPQFPNMLDKQRSSELLCRLRAALTDASSNAKTAALLEALNGSLKQEVALLIGCAIVCVGIANAPGVSEAEQAKNMYAQVLVRVVPRADLVGLGLNNHEISDSANLRGPPTDYMGRMFTRRLSKLRGYSPPTDAQKESLQYLTIRCSKITVKEYQAHNRAQQKLNRSVKRKAAKAQHRKRKLVAQVPVVTPALVDAPATKRTTM